MKLFKKGQEVKLPRYLHVSRYTTRTGTIVDGHIVTGSFHPYQAVEIVRKIGAETITGTIFVKVKDLVPVKVHPQCPSCDCATPDIPDDEDEEEEYEEKEDAE